MCIIFVNCFQQIPAEMIRGQEVPSVCVVSCSNILGLDHSEQCSRLTQVFFLFLFFFFFLACFILFTTFSFKFKNLHLNPTEPNFTGSLSSRFYFLKSVKGRKQKTFPDSQITTTYNQVWWQFQLWNNWQRHCSLISKARVCSRVVDCPHQRVSKDCNHIIALNSKLVIENVL